MFLRSSFGSNSVIQNVFTAVMLVVTFCLFPTSSLIIGRYIPLKSNVNSLHNSHNVAHERFWKGKSSIFSRKKNGSDSSSTYSECGTSSHISSIKSNDSYSRQEVISIMQQVFSISTFITLQSPTVNWADISSDSINSNTQSNSKLFPFVVGGPISYGDESIMSQKEYGTTAQPVQTKLRFGVSQKLADKICCHNRYFAELGGYYKETDFESNFLASKGPLTFYDSVTGKALFVAPIGRSQEEFLSESSKHGWPSFRDSEVVWDNVKLLKNNGEMVSVDGTHLGHNLPDKVGNRYCINLVSIAGYNM